MESGCARTPVRRIVSFWSATLGGRGSSPACDLTGHGALLSKLIYLEMQRDKLLDALHLALPFVEDCESDPCYKAGAAAKAVASIKAAIAHAKGANA